MKKWVRTFDNGNKETIYGSNKYQEIKYNKDGQPYVRFKNIRLYLDEFMCSHNGFKEETALLNCEICAGASDTVYSGYLLHINNNNDQAKVFYSVC